MLDVWFCLNFKFQSRVFIFHPEYIQKNLRLTLDEISKATASKVDSQKYQATDVSG